MAKKPATLRVSDLAPNPKNPRKISDAKLEQLKKALVEFGDLSGIVFNRRTGQLVGGHQRSKVLDSGAEVVIAKSYPKPTKTGTVAEGYVTDYTGERYAYREVDWDKHREMAANVAANKGAGEWDLPELTTWLKELASFDVDFDLDLTMFDKDELAPLGLIEVAAHTRVGATGVDEDEVPEKAPPRTKLGDVYRLGDHRLMCGDSMDEKSLARLLKGTEASACISDPPYGIDWDTDHTRFTGGVSPGRKNRTRIANDAVPFDPKPWAGYKSVVLFGANFFASSLPVGTWLVWDKRFKNGEAFLADAEVAWMKGGKGVYIHSITSQGFVRPEKTQHPTQKPIALMEWCIEKAKAGDTVLDPFGGSGSTLIACEKLQRRCFMMELDPAYCDVIIERWEKYTGRQAKLVAKASDPKPKLRKRAEQLVNSSTNDEVRA